MKNLHALLIRLATISIPLSLIVGTIWGFSSGYLPFVGFNFSQALFGAAVGLTSAALGASVLVILLETLSSLERIEGLLRQRRD